MKPASATQIRILIVDDETLIRSGLRMIIENRPGLKVVGEAGNKTEALRLAEKDQPDIILLDVNLRGSDGLDFLPQLRSSATASRVLVLTGMLDQKTHDRAMQVGAMGVVLKDNGADTLIKAIERVHAGEVWLDRSALGRFFSERLHTGRENEKGSPEAANIKSLSDREREVVTLIGVGLKNKQIAERLFISETTVRHHLTSVFSKLDVSDRLELVIYAYRHGLAKPPS
jgi:two-component system nitrate/nitrite response regulator NarL